MQSIICILLLAVFVATARLILEMKNVRYKIDGLSARFANVRPYTNAEETPANTENEEKRMTKSLLRSTLTNMGCTVEEDDEKLWTEYQGENFVFYCNEESPSVRIIDYSWYSQQLDDLTELSCLKSAINRTNMRSDSTIVYAIDKENSEALVHSSREIIFIKEIPALEDYIRRQFHMMLILHRWLFEDMNEVRKENA